MTSWKAWFTNDFRLQLWIRAFHVNGMIHLLRQVKSSNWINIKRHVESLRWIRDMQQNRNSACICTDQPMCPPESQKRRGGPEDSSPHRSFSLVFTPPPGPWSLPFPDCCKSYPGSRAQIFLQGGRSQREAAARCLDSESKILIQAGVSEELRHGLCALSAVVSLLNSYHRLPSNGARKKSCTPSFEEGKCLLPQLNPRKKMEIMPGFKMQGVTEKGGAPFHTRVPELTQVSI